MQLEGSSVSPTQNMSTSTARGQNCANPSAAPAMTKVLSITEQILEALKAQTGNTTGPMSRVKGEEFLRKNMANPEVFEEMLRLTMDVTADCKVTITSASLRLASVISLKSMFKDAMNRYIMILNSPEPPKLPQHQIRLGGPTIQNVSRIVETEKPELTLQERMNLMVVYIRSSIKFYDYSRICGQDLLVKNYSNVFNSILLSMQRR